MLLIPIYSIQHDSDIYANADQFAPERFDESVGGIKRYKDNGTFLSFGDGPRICLGCKIPMSILLSILLINQFNRYEVCLCTVQGSLG